MEKSTLKRLEKLNQLSLTEKEENDFLAFFDERVGELSELEKIDVIDKNAVKDSVRIKVKKAYPAYFGAYSDFDKVRNYLDGIENLWCIGRNGQHKYNNMDHSMLSAIEAVRCVKNGVTDKTAVWEVNTEKEYHEVKSEDGNK